MYKTRRCKRCNVGGAYPFNDLCGYHWDQLIEINIEKLKTEWQKEEWQNKKDP